jgi:hypothetical protein
LSVCVVFILLFHSGYAIPPKSKENANDIKKKKTHTDYLLKKAKNTCDTKKRERERETNIRF